MPLPAGSQPVGSQAKVDPIDLVHRDSLDLEADLHPPAAAKVSRNGQQGQPSSRPASRRPSMTAGRSASELLQAPFSFLQRKRTRRRRVTDSVLAGIRRHYAPITAVVSYVGLGLVLYAAMYLLIGKPMLPYGRGWSVFLLWVCAHIGGFLAAQVGLPPLLGMLIVGIILVNIPQDPIRGLPASWSTKIRTGGLATILMRAGLKIDKNAFKRAGRVVLSLALVPVICEAIVDGFCFYWLFSMPIALSLTAGFIMAAISPTVMVTGMLELQRRGYGAAQIIPSIEMAAAGLDSIAAIVGFAVCSGIAIPSGNLVYSILSGPLQVLYGLIAALGGALVCSWTRVWNNAIKRVLAVFVTGLALMWLGLQFKYLGASSVACLSLTILTSLFWEKGIPPYFSKGAARQQGYAKDADSKLALVWVILVQPLLFGAIGAEINFHNIPGSIIVKTIIILALGMCATRLPTAFAVLQLSSFSMQEKMFVAMTWIPKATIQGALGSLPLLLITSRETHQADYEQQVAHGNIILHSTAFAIIIAAPIGLLVIALLGPIWLSKDKPADAEGSAPSMESATSDDSSDGESETYPPAPFPHAVKGQAPPVDSYAPQTSRRRGRRSRDGNAAQSGRQLSAAEAGLGASGGVAGDVPVRRGSKAMDPLEPVPERTPTLVAHLT